MSTEQFTKEERATVDELVDQVCDLVGGQPIEIALAVFAKATGGVVALGTERGGPGIGGYALVEAEGIIQAYFAAALRRMEAQQEKEEECVH